MWLMPHWEARSPLWILLVPLDLVCDRVHLQLELLHETHFVFPFAVAAPVVVVSVVVGFAAAAVAAAAAAAAAAAVVVVAVAVVLSVVVAAALGCESFASSSSL